MPFAPSKILIFGGTGTIGRYITASLLRTKPAQLALFTSANTAASKASLLDTWKKQGLSIIVGDITKDDDVKAAYQGVDTVVSAVGRDILAQQLNLLKLAEESGVQWFLPSEYGTDIEHNDKSPHEKPHQNKLKVRKYVTENVRRLKVTYVVTGPYFDMWVNTMAGIERAGGFFPDKKEAYVIDEGEGKVGFCTMWDVGTFVAATLRKPDATMGKAIKVQSFVVTPNEVVAEYERQTGAKWTVHKTPLAQVKEMETQAWESGNPKATSLTLRRIWGEGGTLYEKNDNDLLDLQPGELETLDVVVKKALNGGYKTDF